MATAASVKFKSIWYSLLQAQNTALVQKTIKHVDNSNDNTTATPTSPTASTCSTPGGDVDDEYRRKREKNNESVRKSRAKNRVKVQECATRVQELRGENMELTKKLDKLQTELYTLRTLFQQCFPFNSNNLNIKPSDIPTSTLYTLVMNNKSKLLMDINQPSSSLQNTLNNNKAAAK